MVIHMQRFITLASTSEIRQKLLRSAGVDFRVEASDVDEGLIKESLKAHSASPAEIAIALADAKASSVSEKNTSHLVIGCDQVLAFGNQIFSKPESKNTAAKQLRSLRGQEHKLISAVVIYEDRQPVWSFAGTVTLTMRDFSDNFLKEYLDRNWPSIHSSVGGYKLEEEGVRLFSSIAGDYFTVLGLPLLEVLDYLGKRGAIEV